MMRPFSLEELNQLLENAFKGASVKTAKNNYRYDVAAQDQKKMTDEFVANRINNPSIMNEIHKMVGEAMTAGNMNPGTKRFFGTTNPADPTAFLNSIRGRVEALSTLAFQQAASQQGYPPSGYGGYGHPGNATVLIQAPVSANSGYQQHAPAPPSHFPSPSPPPAAPKAQPSRNPEEIRESLRKIEQDVLPQVPLDFQEGLTGPENAALEKFSKAVRGLVKADEMILKAEEELPNAPEAITKQLSSIRTQIGTIIYELDSCDKIEINRTLALGGKQDLSELAEKYNPYGHQTPAVNPVSQHPADQFARNNNLSTVVAIHFSVEDVDKAFSPTTFAQKLTNLLEHETRKINSSSTGIDQQASQARLTDLNNKISEWLNIENRLPDSVREDLGKAVEKSKNSLKNLQEGRLFDVPASPGLEAARAATRRVVNDLSDPNRDNTSSREKGEPRKDQRTR